MNCDDIISHLKSLGNPENVAGMARFGISSDGTLGVPMPALRALAKQLGRDHELAGELWAAGIHEARILAALVDEPARVTAEQMERWVVDFDSWDVCDQCIGNLFDRTVHAWEKAEAWSGRDEEFVKRAGFVMMATLAVHDKKAPDENFMAFLPLIRREATDGRNFVRKAVNWALRGIGKRNRRLYPLAMGAAEELAGMDDRTARWIGGDALRELRNPRIIARIKD